MSRSARRFGAIGAVLGTAVFLWPARSGLIGDPTYEVHNHLWYFAHALVGIQGNFPAGWDLPLMDPPNLPWFALGWLVSPAAAWNTMAVANVLLGCLGGWLLGERIGGTPASAWVAMALVGWSAFLGGAIEFGITEAWPLGWFALHLWAMEGLAGRGPSPKPPTTGRRDAVIAGITLGIFALTGWYHAAFALVVEPALAWRVRRPRVLAAVGGIALAMVLPRFLQLLPHLGVWADRAAALSDPTDIRAWDRVERFGVDLLRFGPSTQTFTPSTSVYLGVGALIFAVLGGRRAWTWLAIAAPLWLLALGHWLRIGGKVVKLGGPVELPAGWLVDHLESARFITHWYRAAGPATVLLAAAASVGVASGELRLSRLIYGPTREGAAAGAESGSSGPPPGGAGGGLRWLGPLLAAFLLGDSVALSATRWPRMAAPLPVPPALPLDGPVLDLPVDDNHTRPETYGSRRPYWMWQLVHRQPVAENYEAADAVLAASGEARTLQEACGGLPRPRPGASAAGAVDPGSESISVAALGFRWIVVHDALAPSGCAAAVEARFGPPTQTVDGASAWHVEGGAP